MKQSLQNLLTLIDNHQPFSSIIAVVILFAFVWVCVGDKKKL